MDKIYFSKQNVSIIYETIQKRLVQNIGFDISKDDRFQNELIKIMKSVFNKKNTFQYPPNASPLDQSKILSQNVIQISLRYFTENISQINNKNDSLNREMLKKNDRQVNNSMSQRPVNSTYIEKNNVSNNYASLLKERENKAPMPQMPQSNTPVKPPSFQDKSVNQSNDDVARRFSELSSSRRNEFENLAPVKSQNSMQNMPSVNTFEHPSQQQSFLSQSAMQPTNAPYFNQQNALTNSENSLQSSFMNNDTNSSVLEQQFNNNFGFNSNQTSQYTADQANQFQQAMGRQPSLNQGAMQYNNEPSIVNMESDNFNMDDIYNSISQNQFNPLNENNTSSNSFEQSFSNPISSLNPSFEDRENSIDKLFPKNPHEYVNNSTKQINNTPITNNKISAEMEVLKESVERHQSYIDATTQKIDKLVDAINKQDIGRFYNTIIDIPRLIQAQKEQPLTVRTHNLIISSKDRNLYNKEFDKYNFRVVFGADGDYTDTNYKNTSNNNGLNTINLTNQTYVSSSSSNPSVQQVLKNITSIKLCRVIIPKPHEDVHYPDPYYLVSVDEFNSNIISSKSFTDKIFCKVIFDKEVKFRHRSYLYYTNNDDDFTMFYASPLGKLDRLTLKLLDSDGNSVKETFNDIDWVETTGGSDTSKEFYNNTFQGDKILQEGNNRYVVSSISGAPNYGLTTTLRNTNSPSAVPNQFIVNLSNQIEYVFEIKTTEPDSTNLVRPSIN